MTPHASRCKDVHTTKTNPSLFTGKSPFIILFFPMTLVCQMLYFNSGEIMDRASIPVVSSKLDKSISSISIPTDMSTFQKQLGSSSFRFPSVKERVRFYMSGWYNLRVFNVTDACSKSILYDSSMQHLETIGRKTLLVEQGLVPRPGNTSFYMSDIYDYLLDALSEQFNTSNGPSRLLTHFGDLRRLFDFPVFVKTRPADHGTGSAWLTNPILAPLNMRRHFIEPIQYFQSHKPDRPWYNKTNTLVWRGVSTGIKDGGIPHRLRVISNLMNSLRVNDDSAVHVDSLIDIGFTSIVRAEPGNETAYEHLLKDMLGYEEQLQYKYLLNLEGNDVSTGLKWMLLSNSVVFMPIPTCVSWAMEQLLCPWFHYIPIRDDMMDLMEKINWCMENDATCERISLHATQFMNDLWMSPQAKKDQKAILKEMMERYQSFYGKQLASCAKGQ